MKALWAALLLAAPAPETQPALVDAATVVPGLQVELKYSTTDNFLHADVYGDLDRCLLRPEAAAMLAEAARALPPDLRLHAWDCARPRHVQVAMWKIVEGTPQQPYVANPAAGSIHNFGCAVDLTLASADGTPLDMGTPFDHFGPEAEPRREAEMLKAGRLTPGQVAHRHVLRDAMVKAGFRPLGNEWWHFDCAAPAQVRKSYPILP